MNILEAVSERIINLWRVMTCLMVTNGRNFGAVCYLNSEFRYLRDEGNTYLRNVCKVIPHYSESN